MGTGNIRLSLPSQIPSCCLHFHFLSVRTNTNKAELNVHCAFYIFALSYFSRIIFLYFGIVNFYKLPQHGLFLIYPLVSLNVDVGKGTNRWFYNSNMNARSFPGQGIRQGTKL